MTRQLDALENAGGIDAEAGPSATACLGFYRKLTAGLAVVTSHDGLGPVGLTASSVTSVSLRPPMLSVCVASGSTTLAAISARKVLAVHLLRDDQSALAETFSRAGNVRQRFAGLAYQLVLGAPVLSQAWIWTVCFLEGAHVYGDHTVVIGRLALTRAAAGRPLLWHDRAYAAVASA